MLRGIRKASANWVGKAIMATVMGFLILSFGLWGIADIFRGFGASTVATIGRVEIGIEQFRQYYNDQLQQVGRRIGRPLTSEQARAVGFDRQVLSQLLSDAALDETARRMRLGISDAEISKRITQDPTFRGVNGQFNRDYFLQVIRQAGYTEPRFVAEQRKIILRKQISDTLTAGVAAPAALIDVWNHYTNEQRSIAYVRLGAAQAGDVPAPTPEQIAQFFEERKAQFRAPEYRKITVLEISVPMLAESTVISDEDARAAFERDKARYGAPEKRHLRQIVFPNAEAAKAARDAIAGGATFDSVAEQRGLKPSDTDLGTVDKASMVDKAVADAAFATPEGQVSAPVAGRFGVALIDVVKVEPEQVPTYEQVSFDIRMRIAMERATSQLTELYNKVEDARAGGDKLADVAATLKLPVRVIDAVDRAGRTPNGERATGLPGSVDLLRPAFASDVGVENDALQYNANQFNSGYVWFDVDGVTPSRERTLDEAKDLVTARWREEEIAKRLSELATSLVDQARGGASFEKLAADKALKVETAADLKRTGNGGDVPPQLVDQAFRLAKDGVATTAGEKIDERFVVKLTAIGMPAAANAPELQQATDALKQATALSLLSEYLARTQTDIGVSINQTAFAQATGAANIQ